MDAKRQEFEALMKAKGYGYSEPMTYADGSYRSMLWGAAWFAYCAAEARIAQAPPREPTPAMLNTQMDDWWPIVTRRTIWQAMYDAATAKPEE